MSAGDDGGRTLLEQGQNRGSRPDEMTVLGAMMTAGPDSAVPTALRAMLTAGGDGTGEQHFVSGPHRTVWRSILALMDRGMAHDVQSVWGELSVEKLAQLGNGAYLIDLGQAAAVPEWALQAAERLGYATVAREMTRSAVAMTSAAATSALHDMPKALAAAQQDIEAVTLPGARTNPGMITWPTLSLQVLDEMERLGAEARLPTTSGFTTPWPDLNRLLGPVAPGAMIIIAGRPGMAKSTVLRNIALHNGITLGRYVPLFSLEMSSLEIGLAMMAHGAKVELDRIRQGQLDDQDWAKLAKYLGESESARFEVDATANMNLGYVNRVLTQGARRHGQQPAFYGFDYLQLGTELGHGSRQEEVSAMSRGHKLLCKEHDTVGIVLSQLNRGPEGRADKLPQLSDLRESGSLEQDADIVILLHREDYYDHESPRAGEIDLIVAKNRNGPTGVVTLAAQLHMSRLVSMEPELPTRNQES